MYQQLWNAYLNKHEFKSLTDSANCILSTSVEDNKRLVHLMHRIEGLLKDSNIQKAFECYVMEQEDKTLRLWTQFVLRDCFSYVGLYLYIRGCTGNCACLFEINGNIAS